MSHTRVILLRHGETAWNAEGRYQGQLDSPLTASGLAQAHALAGRLSGERFAALYSSDLGRARQTAEAISARTDRPIITHAGLRERNLGAFQGSTRAEAKARWPEDYRQLRSGHPDYAPPEGESQRAMTVRIEAALADITAPHPDQTIVAITHGGVLSALLRHVLGLPIDTPRRFARVNASWNVFTVEKGKWMLETWGDTSHLGGMITSRE